MYRVGLENSAEGRSQAWVLGHPGCFAYGSDGLAALAIVPQALKEYQNWIAAHTTESWLVENDIETCEFQLEETWECYSINDDYELVQDGYEVNAWFRHDWIPLSEEDIHKGFVAARLGQE